MTYFPVSSLWAISGRPWMLVSIWTGIGIWFSFPFLVSGGVGSLIGVMLWFFFWRTILYGLGGILYDSGDR